MKKKFSIILTAIMIFTTVTPVFADSAESISLEKAIQQVKSVINIPKEATEFEYDAWDDPTYKTVWNLSWSDKKYETTIQVGIDENGQILSYYSYEKREGSDVGTVSRDQGQKNAEVFLEKILPNGMKDIQLSSARTYSTSHSFQYDFCPGGIPATYASFSIDVDKNTGQIIHYYGHNLIRSLGDTFPTITDPIGEDRAATAYLENNGLALIYQSYYDWEARSLKIFPVFTLHNGIYVDAKTGSPVKEYEGSGIAYNKTADAGGSTSASGQSRNELSPAEKQAVDSVTGILSKDAALKAVLSKLPSTPAKSTPTNANLSSPYDEKEKYIWYFYFEDMSASINAKTGQLVSYYHYGDTTKQTTGKIVSRETAEKTAYDYLKKTAGDKAALVSLSEFRSNLEVPVPIQGKEMVSSGSYLFAYTRQVNGTEFPGNGIFIAVDPVSGEITQYSLQWYDDAKFSPVEGAMEGEKAFEIFASQNNFGLMYIKADEKAAALVYGFYQMPAYSLEPVNGEKLGYDGMPYREEPNVKEYNDLSGKWYEDTVNRLLDNGYYIEGENFNGGWQITQEEFLRYLYAPSQSNYGQDAFYEMLIRSKIIEEGEKAPDRLLARQDAAKFSIRYLGLGKAAQDGNIFKSVYTDALDPAYAGYAALAKSLSIMNGDSGGNFNGEKILTRAEAATVILRTLESK